MRAAYEIWDEDDFAVRLAALLIWTGQFSEGAQLARKAKQTEWRDRMIGEAAIRVAGELRTGDERTQLLERAAWWAMFLQRYDAARDLFAESGKGPAALQAA